MEVDHETATINFNLSEIIEVLNKRFSTEFNDADKLFFDAIEEELFADDKPRQQALANSIENFEFGFDDVYMDKKVYDRLMK